jgi:precorrin-3B methylase
MHFYIKIENMTGVTSGVGAACYSGTPMLAPCDFFFIRLAQSLIPVSGISFTQVMSRVINK